MSNEILSDRRKALEDAFFARESEAQLRRLRQLDETKRRKEALAAASGITNEAVLDKLAALDISSSAVAALALVPLVAIAWADGSIDDRERAAVFAKAQEEGLSTGDVSHELFETWLKERPPATLLPAWRDYVRALMEPMSPEDRRFFKERVLTRARSVAEAAGGFLGMGNRISPAEQRLLDELAAAFPD